MKKNDLLLLGHWGLNVTVEANSKDEALEYAKKRAEEVSGPMNLTHDEHWIDGEDNVEICPDCGQLHNLPSGRSLH